MAQRVERDDCVGVLYRNLAGRRAVRNGVITRVTTSSITVKHLNIFGRIFYTYIPRSRIIRVVQLEV